MDSYRPNRCGGYQANSCRNANTRCSYPTQPARNRMVTPECDRTPDRDCSDSNRHMAHMPVGMGYIPMQKWEKMYDPDTALCQGTAFPSLNLIFCGVRG